MWTLKHNQCSASQVKGLRRSRYSKLVTEATSRSFARDCAEDTMEIERRIRSSDFELRTSFQTYDRKSMA